MIIPIFMGVVYSCEPDSSPSPSGNCGPSGARLEEGPRGGCYYINSNGNQTYVDRSCC